MSESAKTTTPNSLSIVVATHHDPLGLYLTVFSLLSQLQDSGLKWEIVIAADSGSETKWEKIPNVRCLRIQTGSPQDTRDAGIRAAKYSDVLCIESHVIVSNIENWLQSHADTQATISFPVRVGEGTELFDVYGSETDWLGNLWYKRHIYTPKDVFPYRAVQFGHSAFIINRDWYIENGGYTSLLSGWGGEEPFLCLKIWMLGGTCWMIPSIWHAHYLTSGAHADALVSERMQKNFDIVKYVMSGELKTGLKVTSEMREERKRICAGPFQGDVNKLREFFKREGIES